MNFQTRSSSAHAILPYEVVDRGNEVDVYVYDCNLNGDPDDNRVIFTKNSDGKITGWSYTDDNRYTYSSKRGSLSFIVSLEVIAKRLKQSAPIDIVEKFVHLTSKEFSAKSGNQTLVTYSDGIFSGDTSQTDLVPFTPVTGDTSEELDGAVLCPLTNNTYTYVNNSSEAMVTTLIADKDSAFVIKSDGASQITDSVETDGEKIKVTPSKSGMVSIRYNYGDSDSIQVSGKTDGDVEATVVSGNDGLSFTGYKNVQVTTTTDGEESTQENIAVSPQSEYVISSNGQVSGDFSNVTPEPDNDDSENPNTDKNTDKSTNTKKIAVKQIKLSGISKKIAAGKKLQLSASVKPANATLKAINWKSSNPKVATVSAKGKVSVKKKTGGKSVKITATAKDGSGVKATYNIQVMKGTVKSIKITGAKAVTAGKKTKLKAKISASAGANKKILWSTSNKKYATVNASGKVSTKKAGKNKAVKITAMATDGSGKKTSFKIKIK